MTGIAICGFFDEYRWLSNFWYSEIHISGRDYATVEHFYQASKAKDEVGHSHIASCVSPSLAKKFGKSIEMREDWEQVKYLIMKIGVEAKFRQNYDLKMKLLNTGSAYLEETNHWGDKIWGVCNGVGTNWLGKILMEVRETLKNERFYA